MHASACKGEQKDPLGKNKVYQFLPATVVGRLVFYGCWVTDHGSHVCPYGPEYLLRTRSSTAGDCSREYGDICADPRLGGLLEKGLEKRARAALWSL